MVLAIQGRLKLLACDREGFRGFHVGLQQAGEATQVPRGVLCVPIARQ